MSGDSSVSKSFRAKIETLLNRSENKKNIKSVLVPISNTYLGHQVQ